jgi:hypothetical protein
MKNTRTGEKFSANGLSYLRCETVLDEQPTVENVILEQCLVVYRGGNVKLKNVQFINCIFVFDLTRKPEGDGPRLTQLLAYAPSLSDVRV